MQFFKSSFPDCDIFVSNLGLVIWLLFILELNVDSNILGLNVFDRMTLCEKAYIFVYFKNRPTLK